MGQKWKDEIARREAARARYNRQSLALGLGKLVWFVLLCCTGYRLLAGPASWVWPALLAGELAVFAAACLLHRQVNRRMAREKGLQEAAARRLARLEGRWQEFPGGGEEFADGAHPYAQDLDVVGKRSLFQLLSSAFTHCGRARFAADLLAPAYSREELLRRQKAVEELAGQEEWTAELEYLLAQAGDDPAFPRLLEQLGDGRLFLRSRAARGMLTASRVLTCGSAAAAAVTGAPLALGAASLLILVQLLLWGLGMGPVNRYLGAVRDLSYRLSRYEEPVRAVAEHPFQGEKLREISQTMAEALQGIRSLSTLSRRVSQSRNSLAALALNGLFLWDFGCAAGLSRWKQAHGEKAEGWFAALGELESLMSLANLPLACSTVCLPQPWQGPGLQARGMGHPLLRNEARVCNDFSMGREIRIISGSNMSGKTTFLRTVGVNLVLAQAGGYVCAREFRFAPARLATSMRIADSLSQGISTFYAELKRIKAIVDAARTDPSVFFLIDEIFRGTNSADRQKGAQAVLEALSRLGVSGLITTHDLELCRLEETCPGVSNQCFFERYEQGEILFDYKIHPGVSKTTNGAFLLRQIGLPLPDEEKQRGDGC